jgi:hypothetical protein
MSCRSAPEPQDVVIDGKATGRLSGPDREDAEILANKWLMDLERKDYYRLYEPLKLAVLLDPFLHETYDRLSLDSLSGGAFVDAVADFAENSLFPLQAAEAFKNEPSRMPWGAVGGLFKKNVYRRHLPSDMNAMRMYTGKIPAGCESLTLFLAGLFRLKGVPAGDIVHLRLWGGHTVALVRFEGEHYYIDNTTIERVDPYSDPWLLGEHNIAIFGETAALYRPSFILKAGAFEGHRSLVREISESSGLALAIREDDLAGLGRLDLESLRHMLIEEMSGKDPARARLVAYASQLRDVEDFSVYAAASLRGPLARKLAAKLKGTQAVLDWIDANVEEGSIFADGANRVQMADQTIVYRRGTPLDRALLAYCAFAHQGGKPRLIIEKDGAIVELDGEAYAF